MLQFGVSVQRCRPGMSKEKADKLAESYSKVYEVGFLQDVEIWKHKTRIENPLLCEEDGALYQYRRWYEQFYVDVADVTSDMTDRFELEVDTTARLRRLAARGRGEPRKALRGNGFQLASRFRPRCGGVGPAAGARRWPPAPAALRCGPAARRSRATRAG